MAFDEPKNMVVVPKTLVLNIGPYCWRFSAQKRSGLAIKLKVSDHLCFLGGVVVPGGGVCPGSRINKSLAIAFSIFLLVFGCTYYIYSETIVHIHGESIEKRFL